MRRRLTLMFSSNESTRAEENTRAHIIQLLKEVSGCVCVCVCARACARVCVCVYVSPCPGRQSLPGMNSLCPQRLSRTRGRAWRANDSTAFPAFRGNITYASNSFPSDSAFKSTHINQCLSLCTVACMSILEYVFNISNIFNCRKIEANTLCGVLQSRALASLPAAACPVGYGLLLYTPSLTTVVSLPVTSMSWYRTGFLLFRQHDGNLVGV